MGSRWWGWSWRAGREAGSEASSLRTGPASSDQGTEGSWTRKGQSQFARRCYPDLPCGWCTGDLLGDGQRVGRFGRLALGERSRNVCRGRTSCLGGIQSVVRWERQRDRKVLMVRGHSAEKPVESRCPCRSDPWMSSQGRGRRRVKTWSQLWSWTGVWSWRSGRGWKAGWLAWRRVGRVRWAGLLVARGHLA